MNTITANGLAVVAQLTAPHLSPLANVIPGTGLLRMFLPFRQVGNPEERLLKLPRSSVCSLRMWQLKNAWNSILGSYTKICRHILILFNLRRSPFAERVGIIPTAQITFQFNWFPAHKCAAPVIYARHSSRFIFYLENKDWIVSSLVRIAVSWFEGSRFDSGHKGAVTWGLSLLLLSLRKNLGTLP